MTTKEELSQYFFKLKKAEQALSEYEKYKTRAEKMTSIISDVPSRTNKTSDKVGVNATFMADLKSQYEVAWKDAELERLQIFSKITRLDEPYRTILFMRYIERKNFESIASEIGYSYKQVLRLHGQALNLFEIY